MPNTIVKEIAIKQILPDVKAYTNGSITYAQGDILIYDVANNVVRAATAESEGQYMLGLAAEDIASGVPLSPYSTANDAAQAIPSICGPLYGMTAKLVLKNNDILYPGAYVYANPSSGHYNAIAATAAATATVPIGMNVGAQVTGDGTTAIEVLIGARYPNNTLKF